MGEAVIGLANHLARARVWMRCLIGHHEWTTVVPVDAVTGQRQGVVRDRCLHCGRVTEGWQQSDGPRYHYTHEADRARLVLHNPRIRRCECAACEERRRARRAKRGKVTQIVRSA